MLFLLYHILHLLFTFSCIFFTSQNKSEESAPCKPQLFDGTLPGLSSSLTSSNSKSRPKFGKSESSPVSSSSLLRNILKRSESRLDDDNVKGNMNDNKKAASELLDQIRTFIAFQAKDDGQATTQELLDAFTTKLPPSESANFKAMLREICDFERKGDLGVWVLKEEYR